MAGYCSASSELGTQATVKGGAPPEMIPDMQVLKLMSLPERAGRVATVCGYNHPEAKPFSALVRKLRIDESPQLIAVLRGEMSAVGPQPCTVETAENIMDQLSPREQREWLAARRVAKPGLACMGAEKQYDPAFVPDLREVAYSDIKYVAGASWALDGKIITAIAGGLFTSFMRKRKWREDSA